MDRREVHRVPHDAVAEEIADRGGRIEADQFLRLFGRGRDVRRRDDLRQLGERPVGRRLLLEDVQAGGGDDAAFDRARVSAASSISSPRAVLMMRMPGFTFAKPRRR